MAELAGAGARVAVVANALDNLPEFPRGSWIQDQYETLAAAGLACLELDLRRYYGQPEALRPALAEVDMVWATGGNAFVLRDAMRRSGLDAFLVDLLRDDSLAYGGYSAGACVCGPTLRGLELVDDVSGVPDPVWDGLGVVDFSIAPHCRLTTRRRRRLSGSWSTSAHMECRTGRCATGRRSSRATGLCEPSRYKRPRAHPEPSDCSLQRTLRRDG